MKFMLSYNWDLKNELKKKGQESVFRTEGVECTNIQERESLMNKTEKC